MGMLGHRIAACLNRVPLHVEQVVKFFPLKVCCLCLANKQEHDDNTTNTNGLFLDNKNGCKRKLGTNPKTCKTLAAAALFRSSSSIPVNVFRGK